MQELVEEKLSKDFADILWNLRPASSYQERLSSINMIKKSPELQKQLQKLRGEGIVIL